MTSCWHCQTHFPDKLHASIPQCTGIGWRVLIGMIMQGCIEPHLERLPGSVGRMGHSCSRRWQGGYLIRHAVFLERKGRSPASRPPPLHKARAASPGVGGDVHQCAVLRQVSVLVRFAGVSTSHCTGRQREHLGFRV